MFTPDPALNLNSTYETVAGNFTTAGAQGDTEVKEVYGELLVPLLKDLPALKSLNLELGDRYSEYNTAGNTRDVQGAAELGADQFHYLPRRCAVRRACAQRGRNCMSALRAKSRHLRVWRSLCGSQHDGRAGNVATNPDRAKVQQLCGDIIRKVQSHLAVLCGSGPTMRGGSGNFLQSENQIIEGNPDVDAAKARTVAVGNGVDARRSRALS